MKYISDEAVLISALLIGVASTAFFWPLASEFNRGGWYGVLSVIFASSPFILLGMIPYSIFRLEKYISDKEENYLQTRKNIAEFTMRCRK